MWTRAEEKAPEAQQSPEGKAHYPGEGDNVRLSQSFESAYQLMQRVDPGQRADGAE